MSGVEDKQVTTEPEGANRHVPVLHGREETSSSVYTLLYLTIRQK